MSMTKEDVERALRDMGHHCSCVDLKHITEWIIENRQRIAEVDVPNERTENAS